MSEVQVDNVVAVLRRATVKATAAGELELAAVFVDAQEFYIAIEAQNSRDPHNPYKTRSMHHPLVTGVIQFARAYVKPSRKELAQVFVDLGEEEIAARVLGDLPDGSAPRN